MHDHNTTQPTERIPAHGMGSRPTRQSIFNLNSHFGRFPHSSTGAQKAGGAYLINRSGENDWQERVEEHAILELFFISCQLCFLASYIILNSLSATPGSFE